MKKASAFLLSTGLYYFSAALQGRAATVYVYWDSDTGFSSSSITINVGDTVVWYDNDGILSTEVTCDLSVLDANYFSPFFLMDAGDFNSVTFNSAGQVDYHDSYAFQGTVIVQSAAPPPAIVLSSPRLENGAFLFDAAGFDVGKTNVLVVSTNLLDWMPLKTNVAAGASMTFTNSPGSAHQFFQVYELP